MVQRLSRCTSYKMHVLHGARLTRCVAYTVHGLQDACLTRCMSYRMHVLLSALSSNILRALTWFPKLTAFEINLRLQIFFSVKTSVVYFIFVSTSRMIICNSTIFMLSVWQLITRVKSFTLFFSKRTCRAD